MMDFDTLVHDLCNETVQESRSQPRKNVYALRSGGPRSETGKAASSRNSLRHGLTAKQVVIRGEDQSEFDALHANLIADRKPIGELELQITSEIAACVWRLARARQHEARLLENTFGLYEPAAGKKLELVLRYIGSIERQLNRAIVRVEQLQAERRKREQSKPAVEQKPKVMSATDSNSFSDMENSRPPQFVSSPAAIRNGEPSGDASLIVDIVEPRYASDATKAVSLP
jgi:hypothetical protein